MSMSAPVAALTVLGIPITILGLVVGGSVQLAIVGLAAIAFAGVLRVAGSRVLTGIGSGERQRGFLVS